MEPSYTRLFHPHQLGIKDPTLHVTPIEVTSYCAYSGLTFTVWYDSYNNATIDPTCVVVHITGSFSTSSSCSSSAAGSSSQGTYMSNSTTHTPASTSYGVYHGPFSRYNTSGIVPTCLPQSKPHSDLYAAGMSLQSLYDIALPSIYGAPTVRNIVLVTDSNYLVSCLTQHVSVWNSNGYRNAKKKEVANADTVKWVEKLVVGLERRGVGVKFWKVDKKENSSALLIAKKVLDAKKEQEELRKSAFRMQLGNMVRISRY